MAVRQDQVQLDIRFVTDESKALAKTIVDTKKYNDEIKAAQKNIADYRKELKDAGADEVKRAQALAKIAVEEAKVAKGFEDIAAAGKKVEGLDLSKVAPAQLVERARQLALEMRNIPQSAPRFKELQAELVRVNAQLRNVNEASKGSDKPGGGIIGNISSLITNGPRAIPIIGSIVAGFQALSGAFSGANKLEQLTISFETFLGSADKAKAVIADLKEFEVKTPFEAEQVNTAGRALLAFGFTTKELIPTLTRIGDIASGTGKDFNELALIYGKAKTQGLIQGEELNQLAEAGIPIYAELAKVLNVNENQIRKLGEQGKIQFKDLEQVFQNLAGAGGKFAGLMEKQSQSLGGLYSTLKSALSNLLTSVGTTLAPLAKGGMELLIGAVSILGKVITPVFKVFETFFKGAVEGAKLVANALGNNVPKAIQSMGEAFLNIPVLGDAFKFLLVPIRLVIDSFESLKATATGVVAGLVDIFTTGGQNVGKAYTDARNKVLQEERQQEARDRAEDARDERQLTAEEKAALLAAELGCAPSALQITNQRGQAPRVSVVPPVRASSAQAQVAEQAGDQLAEPWAKQLAPVRLSIAHAAGWSLVAWHRGPVGVDLQDRAAQQGMDAAERRRLSVLYLGQDEGSNHALAHAGRAPEAIKNEAFAARWAAHEARLKCLGQPLQEWSPTLQAALAGCTARSLTLPVPMADAAPGWAGAVAWQDLRAPGHAGR